MGEISGVNGVSVPMQDRRKNRTNAIESDADNLNDMFMIYLTDEVNMLSRCEIAGKREMLMGLAEIGN